MTKTIPIRESSFGGLARCHHGRECGGVQTDAGAAAETFISLSTGRERETGPGLGF